MITGPEWAETQTIETYVQLHYPDSGVVVCNTVRHVLHSTPVFAKYSTKLIAFTHEGQTDHQDLHSSQKNRECGSLSLHHLDASCHDAQTHHDAINRKAT